MKKIEVIIRPEKLEDLKKILTKNEYSGMTWDAVIRKVSIIRNLKNWDWK